PEKQLKLLKAILDLYTKGAELVKGGTTTKEIAALEVVSEMVRLKSEIPNNELERIDDYRTRLAQGLDSLKERKGEV
ncbi:MAG: hypothetical protein Q7J01_03950, partial [Syntrophales bacterium]|nr:hypothetical protein [Syntrophales bacterium]